MESAPLGPSLELLLSRAPASLFPRARELYFHKYCLEGFPPDPGLAVGTRFRTFLLAPFGVITAPDGLPTLHLAVVHWQAPQVGASLYLDYLEGRWQLNPADLEPAAEAWFRDGGAFARFSVPAP